jgi:hypothetical protein
MERELKLINCRIEPHILKYRCQEREESETIIKDIKNRYGALKRQVKVVNKKYLIGCDLEIIEVFRE